MYWQMDLVVGLIIKTMRKRSLCRCNLLMYSWMWTCWSMIVMSLLVGDALLQKYYAINVFFPFPLIHKYVYVQIVGLWNVHVVMSFLIMVWIVRCEGTARLLGLLMVPLAYLLRSRDVLLCSILTCCPPQVCSWEQLACRQRYGISLITYAHCKWWIRTCASGGVKRKVMMEILDYGMGYYIRFAKLVIA